MTKHSSVVAIYKSHAEAEDAVKDLQQSGFDMKMLSIEWRRLASLKTVPIHEQTHGGN
jgi:hypothetical protein